MKYFSEARVNQIVNKSLNGYLFYLCSSEKMIFTKLSLNKEMDDTAEAAVGTVLWKKGVLKNFTYFTGKHLCWSLTVIKPESLQPY